MSTIYGVIVDVKTKTLVNDLTVDEVLNMTNDINNFNDESFYIDNKHKYEFIKVAGSSGVCYNQLVRFLPNDTKIYPFDNDSDIMTVDEVIELIE